MPDNVEVEVPNQASERARDVIPSTSVTELASALKAITGISDIAVEASEGVPEERLTEEEYIVKCLMEHARTVLANYRRDQRVKELEDSQVNDF